MSTEDESRQRPAQRPTGGQQKPAPRRVASTREAEESEEEKAERASAAAASRTGAMIGYSSKDEKPPFDLGDGWLDWLDKKAAKLLDITIDGTVESLEGKGRAAKLEAQHEHHHHRNYDNPDSPPRTPAGTPNPAGNRGRSST